MKEKMYIFDFFGVICSEVAPHWLRQYFPDARATVIKRELIGKADTGKITQEELFNELGRLASISPSRVLEEWLSYVSINEGVIELLTELSHHSRIALLTNAPAPFVRKIIRENNLDHFFEKIMVSSEEKIAKPSLEIYHRLLNTLQVEPSEAIIIDDNPDNIKGAQSVGITTVLFTSVQQTRQALRNTDAGMSFPKNVTVNDLPIDLSYLTSTQKEYFSDLANRIKQNYVTSGLSRYVVSISGPSGSGKSVLSVILRELLQSEKDFAVYPIDLDAFHFSNSELRERGVFESKGRYDTYDTQQLISLLTQFNDNQSVAFPEYSRIDHEPHQDKFLVQPGKAILLLAGLWFQRNDSVWNEVRAQIDHTYSIVGPEDDFKQNTIDRHIRGGRTKDDADQFYNTSDARNTAEIIKHSSPSDTIIPYYKYLD